MVTGGVPTLVLWDVPSCSFPVQQEVCDSLFAVLTKIVRRYSHCSTMEMIAYVVNHDFSDSILGADMELSFATPDTHLENMISRMKDWAESVPAPSNYFVISGDARLLSTLQNLHSRDYNILLAHPHGHDNLVAIASCVWNVKDLVIGGPPYLVCMKNEPRSLYEEGKVPTLVLWDVRSCPIPESEWECYNLFNFICTAVSKNCSCSRITMVAYGVDESIPDIIRHHLIGISLIPDDHENHLEKMILMMKDWAESVPAPANYLVISSDESMSSILQNFHDRDYNILVAHPHGHYPAHLAVTASCVWDFRSLMWGGAPYIVHREMVPRQCRPKSGTKNLILPTSCRPWANYSDHIRHKE